jgi:hypothetical protein
MVGPSPVTSNGTETTEIEDDAVDEEEERLAAPVERIKMSDASVSVPHLISMRNC